MEYQKSENGWELCTLANGHLSSDNFCLEEDDISAVEDMLRLRYGEIMKKEHIEVGYDNWSGVYIMQALHARTDTSDDIIRKIYKYLSENYEMPRKSSDGRK